MTFAAGDGRTFAARGVSKGERLAIEQLPADLIHAIVDRRPPVLRASRDRSSQHLRAAWYDLHHDGSPHGKTGEALNERFRLTLYI
jgi:hypothetical protein